MTVLRTLTSRENPLVRDLILLSGSSRERRRRGLTVLDGERLLKAWEESGGVAEAVLASETCTSRKSIRDWISRFPAKSRAILSDSLIDRISQVMSSSGLVAIVPTPEPQPLPGFLGDCVMLDSIQDPGNLGSILRSAVAAGIPRVLLSQGSVFAWAPKVVRAGMGAHFRLSIHEQIDLAAALDRAAGLAMATVPRGGVSLPDCDLRQPVAWLFGNEGSGLSQALLEKASGLVTIPMPGPAESLNLAAAAAICLFEQSRQRSGVRRYQ